jgi:hypothetical protein
MSVIIDGTTGIVAPNITDSSLTSGRVPFITTNGDITDSANLVFSGTTLTTTGLNTGTTTFTNLTASTALALDASKNVVSVTNTGSGNNVLATSPTLVTPDLGTPSALVVTHATGTASININGTVGATTPTTGAFTTATLSSNLTLNGGTANGVLFLNGSKVATSGSALTFDGTNLLLNTAAGRFKLGNSGDTTTHFIDIVDTNGSAFYFGVDNSAGTFFGAGAFGRSIYSEGNHPILFFVNAAQKMRLSSDGTFRVKGAGSAGTTDAVQFSGSAPANTLILDSSGNLNIGGTGPTYPGRLNVSGGGIFSSATTFDPDQADSGSILLGTIADGSGFSAPGIGWKSGGAGNTAGVVSGNNTIFLGTGNGSTANSLTTRLYLNSNEAVFNSQKTDTDFRVASVASNHALFLEASSGNLGIGTSLPEAKLAVDNTSTSIITNSVFGAGEAYGGISSRYPYHTGGTQIAWMSNSNYSTNTAFLADINAYSVEGYATGVYFGAVSGTTSNGPANFVIGRRTGAQSWVESLRIDTSGNLGIGTSSPSDRLTVVNGTGAQAALFTCGSGATQQAIVTFSNSTNSGYLAIAGVGASSVVPSWADGSIASEAVPSGSGNYIFGAYTGNIVFQTNNRTTRAQISTDGTFRVKGAGTAGSTDAVQFSGSAPASTLVLDSSGRLGIGTSSPLNPLHVNGPNSVAVFSGSSTALAAYQTFFNNSTSQVYFGIESSTGTGIIGTGAAFGMVLSTALTNPLCFGTNSTERMRLDSSGNLLVGTTSLEASGGATSTALIKGGYFKGDKNVLYANSTNSSSSFEPLGCIRQNSVGNLIAFWYTLTTQVGTIGTNGVGTTYNTSSDYRLKENIQPMTNALAKVAALKPCTFNWKANGSAGQGFIAHELAEVVPDCVTGEKDAVNEDGAVKPQGVDTSFLVATLTAAIQEQQSIIESLTARIAALEAA